MNRINPEATAVTEENARKIAPWLGGYFEAGGTLGFGLYKSTKKGKTYTYGIPFMSSTDKNPIVANTFKEMFGGGTKPNKKGSFQWTAERMRAYIIASSFAPFAPIRKEFMAALANWINSDVEEKVRIAREMKGFDRSDTASPEEYASLVVRPDFLAGTIDSRGTIVLQQNAGEERRYPRLNLYSSNRPMLECMKGQYGGHIGTTGHKGDTIVIDGRKSKLKKDKIYWTPPVAKTGDIFNMVLPHLKFTADRVEEVLASRA